jgi:hypothetical protein
VRENLPDPVVSGAGVLIHVTDAPGGADVCLGGAKLSTAGSNAQGRVVVFS